MTAVDVIKDVIYDHLAGFAVDDGPDVPELAAAIAARILSCEHTTDAHGHLRMTDAQVARLVALCRGYGVPFREDDYHLCGERSISSPEGWVEGYVGPVFVGVSPEGESHS